MKDRYAPVDLPPSYAEVASARTREIVNEHNCLVDDFNQMVRAFDDDIRQYNEMEEDLARALQQLDQVREEKRVLERENKDLFKAHSELQDLCIQQLEEKQALQRENEDLRKSVDEFMDENEIAYPFFSSKSMSPSSPELGFHVAKDVQFSVGRATGIEQTDRPRARRRL